MCLWQFNKQISAVIIDKSMFRHVSANIAHNSTNKLSRPIYSPFSGSTIIKGPFLY